MMVLTSHIHKQEVYSDPGGWGGGDLVLTMTVCVCREVKDMGPLFGSK